MTGGGEFLNVTHCIFDMDGLLLDTEKLYTQATQTILDEFGKTYTWDVKSSVMGFHSDQVAKLIVNTYELPISWQEYSKRQCEITKRIMRDAELMPDTEGIYESVMQNIAHSYGKEYTLDLRLRILGTTELVSAQLMVNELKLPITIEEYLDQYHKMCEERLPNAELMNGAQKLLCHLNRHGIPFALATSSSERSMGIKSKKHQELFKLFSHFVCGTSDPEVKRSKPAPDIYLIAAARFPDKPEPKKCLVFEDAPNGVAGAISAGMQVIMVPDPETPVEMRKNATIVLNSLEEFQPEMFGLPPFPKSTS